MKQEADESSPLQIEEPSVKRISYIAEISILTILCTAFALDVFWLNSVNLMVDTLRVQFKMTPNELLWIVSGYALTFSSFLLLVGRICDLTNAIYVFIFGLLWFGIFTGLCGFSTTSIQLIIFRSLKGLGAAMTVPAGLSLIVTNFGSNKTKITKEVALTVYSLAASLGNVIGQVLGGALTFALGWEWAFFIVAIFTLLVSLISFFIIPKYCDIPEKQTHLDPHHKIKDFFRRLDVVGVLLASIGCVLFTFAISSGNELAPWSSVEILLPFCISIVFIVGFFFYEKWTKYPLIPPDVWTKEFTVIMIIALTYGSFRVSFLYFSALQLQNILGYTVLEASLYSLTLGVSAAITSILNGKLVNKMTNKQMVLLGTTLELIANVLLCFNTRSSTFWMFSFASYILGLSGLIFVFNGLQIKTFEIAKAHLRGIYGGIFNTAVQLSGGVYVAIITSIQIGILGPEALQLEQGYQVAFISIIVVLFIGFVLALKM